MSKIEWIESLYEQCKAAGVSFFDKKNILGMNIKQYPMPIRIQRKRTKGWKMPENSIYVGRPSKWGNPFKFELYNSYGKKGAILYYCINRKIFDPWIYYDSGPFEFKDIIYFYEQWITGKLTDKIGLPDVPKISELKGKNLVCWCPLDRPCHADLLLKLANKS